MCKKFSWVRFHDEVKARYMSVAPHLWWGDDLDVRFYALKQLMDLRNKKILDIGCNVGITLSFLHDSNELYGIDIDEFCVKKAKELNPNADIRQASMDSLPFEDESFDVVIMMNVFPYYDFHIDTESKDKFIQNTFSEALRVLNCNGVLHLTTPNGESEFYIGSKVTLSELQNALACFKYSIYGWGKMIAIIPFLSNRYKRYKFIPPKILCRLEFVWIKFINNLESYSLVNKAKNFYVIAKK